VILFRAFPLVWPSDPYWLKKHLFRVRLSELIDEIGAQSKLVTKLLDESGECHKGKGDLLKD